jgi:hypothetical protein
MSKTERRKYQRISYNPTTEIPKLLLTEGNHAIKNISSKAITFLYDKANGLSRGSKLDGTIAFEDGDRLDVKGEILRIEVTFKLSRNIPANRMKKEMKAHSQRIAEKFKGDEEIRRLLNI